MNLFLDRFTTDPRISLKLRTQLPGRALGKQGPLVQIDGKRVELPAKNEAGPADLAFFRDAIVEAVMFPPDESGMQRKNGWHVGSTDCWLFDTVNTFLVGDLSTGGVGYLERCYVLASAELSSNEVIAIDLHDEQYGKIGYFWYTGDLNEGGFPVIAHSFAEWLERTLASGPDILYWEREDFVDLGPAIPGDPNYRPPNRRTRGIRSTGRAGASAGRR